MEGVETLRIAEDMQDQFEKFKIKAKRGAKNKLKHSN